MVLLGFPLERHAVERPGRFFVACGVAFYFACHVLGAIFDKGVM